MSDTVKRAFRTFVQGAIGVFVLVAFPLLQGIIDLVGGGGDVDIDFNLWRNIGIAVIAGGVIGLVSFVQNWLEETTHKTTLPK